MTVPQLDPLIRDTAWALHDQISDQIRRNITSGAWPQNYKLHAESDLAEELDVSRGTVRRALRTLIDEGLLRQIQGRGTFVAAGELQQDFSNPLRSMAEELQAQRIDFTTALVSAERVAAPAGVAGLLELSPGTPTWKLVRVRSNADGEPIMVLENWIGIAALPELDEGAVLGKGLFRHLEEDAGMRITLGRRIVGATAPTPQLSELLRVPAGEPLLHVEQTTYTRGDRPVEYSNVWMPPSRIRLTSLVRRS